MRKERSAPAPASARDGVARSPASSDGSPGDAAVLFSLLDEALLGVEGRDGARERVTLPGLLARWSRGESVEMTALQAHQQHAWHAFTVQLAALALVRAGLTELPVADGVWRQLLVACAAADGAGPEAFALVVEDLAKPAFMQPPVPEGTLKALKNVHDTPGGELDVLITAKNHDVKSDAVRAPSLEAWVIALIVLQTTQGFLGAGNYGIARMNGGFSSRPCIAYGSGLDSAPRFLRDVRRMLEAREVLRTRGFATRRSFGLIWCAPWDGTRSLAVDELDPFFVEICRRVRLEYAGGVVRAYRGSSKVARIAAAELAGNTGDAWTPVAQDGRALTMPEAGFTYERIQNLMFGEWTHGAAGTPSGADSDAFWIGRVLVRGRGKTGGYHERWVPIPLTARRLFASTDARASLGKRAKYWVERAAAARLKVLKPAALAFLQGGPEKLKFDDPRAEPVLRAFDSAIDRIFFPLLFEHATTPPEDADAVFGAKLYELGRAELERAFEALPTSTARRARAIARAERVFHGAARKVLGQPQATGIRQSSSSTDEGATP